MTEKSSWLRRHKTSILLVCSGTRCSAYRENERTISLAVGAPWAQIWLCSPPIVTQNLIFSFLSNKQSNFLLILTYNENIRRMQHTLRATQEEEEKKKQVWAFIFSLSSTSYRPTQCDSYYLDLEGGFITVRLRGCQLGQWCMKLPPFIGMAFNQLLLGICPWLCSGATYNSAPCTCPHLTTPFNAFPPQPHFHSCINIISPVKKTRTTCSLPLLFLMVYAEQPTLSPLNSSPCLWIQPELAQCQQILPQRSCLHCLTLQHAHLPIHHPSFISWTTITLN